MDIDHVWEKLYLAVLGMARSTQPLQERLANAYVSALHQLEDEDLPEDLIDDFEKVIEALTRVGEPVLEGEGSVHATVREMDDETARQLIEEIVDLYDS